MKNTRSMLVDKMDRQIRVLILEYGDGLIMAGCRCREISKNPLRDFPDKPAGVYRRTL